DVLEERSLRLFLVSMKPVTCPPLQKPRFLPGLDWTLRRGIRRRFHQTRIVRCAYMVFPNPFPYPMQKSFGKFPESFRKCLALFAISALPLGKRRLWRKLAATILRRLISRQKFASGIPLSPGLPIDTVNEE